MKAKDHIIILWCAIAALVLYAVINGLFVKLQINDIERSTNDLNDKFTGSLNDVDTLFMETGILIFERPYDSQERVNALTSSTEKKVLEWVPKLETVEDMIERDQPYQDLNIDSLRVRTDSILNNKKEKTK